MLWPGGLRGLTHADPVDQFALHLDCQCLYYGSQVCLGHLAKLGAGVGSENVITEVPVQAVEQLHRELIVLNPHSSFVQPPTLGRVPRSPDQNQLDQV